jgi:protein-S-isoprenylcysteine O-methyltransferase Ste14
MKAHRHFSFLWIASSTLIIAEIVLFFLFKNPDPLASLKIVGCIIWWSGALLGWLPIITFRRRGGVEKGKSYVHTTKLVDKGIYGILRHPQYLAFVFLCLALALISQHWLVILTAAAASVFCVFNIFEADRHNLEKFGQEYKSYMEKVPRMNFVLGAVRALRRHAAGTKIRRGAGI